MAGHPNKKAEAALSATQLRRMLSYDPGMGIFKWLVRPYVRSKSRVGDVAGKPTNKGYVTITTKGHRYLAHRLGWLYMTGEWPKALIDHRDLDRGNNRWSNLREATKSENMINRGAASNSKTGVKGVNKHSQCNSYCAYICVNYKRIYLGSFKTIPEAKEAYDVAAKKYFGEFARAA